MDNNEEYKAHVKRMGELVTTTVNSIEDIVNCGGEKSRKELVERIGFMHRTLQQRFIGEIVIPLVRNMADRLTTDHYDDRNKLACEACAAMLNGLAEKFPHIANGECTLPLI